MKKRLPGPVFLLMGSLFPLILAPMVFVSFGAMFLLFPGDGNKVYTPGTPWAGRTFVIVWNTVGIVCAVHYFTQPGAWNLGGIALFRPTLESVSLPWQ